MEIAYESGITDIDKANARKVLISDALAESKLQFKVSIESVYGLYNIKISTPFPIFDDWEAMSTYIRELIIKHKSEVFLG